MTKATAEIRSLARAHTETVINVLAGIVRQKSASPAARVSAGAELLDRGWGKAKQTIAGDEENPIRAIIEQRIIDPTDKD